MIGDLKEVDFAKYCRKCKNWDCADYEEPCNECQDTPARQDSHKPINFEEKDNRGWSD